VLSVPVHHWCWPLSGGEFERVGTMNNEIDTVRNANTTDQVVPSGHPKSGWPYIEVRQGDTLLLEPSVPWVAPVLVGCTRSRLSQHASAIGTSCLSTEAGLFGRSVHVCNHSFCPVEHCRGG
jgi:hypothetical protein